MGFDKKKECDELYKGLKKDYLEKMVIKRIPFVFICAAADDGKKNRIQYEDFWPGTVGADIITGLFQGGIKPVQRF